MRVDLYKAIEKFKVDATESKEWEKLDDESKEYVNRILRDFERKGIKLPDKERDEVKALQIDIAKEEHTANKAIQDCKEPLTIEHNDKNKGFKGMPEDFINKLTKPVGSDAQGKREVNMKYHEVLPLMRLCENEATR
jgi:Zn-dependent oligopeptidase